MKLDKIIISNFRGIKEEQEISISNLTTFVGKNDSGKSIVLHAIAAFLDNKNYAIEEKDFNINRSSNEVIEMMCHFTDDVLRDKLSEYVKRNRKKDIGIEEEVESIIQDNNKVIVRKTWDKPDKKPSKCEICTVDFKDKTYKNLSDKNDKDLDAILSKLKIEIPPDHPGRNSKLEKTKYIKKHLEDNSFEKEIVWKDDSKIDDLLPEIEFFPADHAISTDTKFNTSLKTETVEFFNQEREQKGSKLKSIEEDATKKIQEEAGEIEKYMQMHVSDLEKVEIEPHFKWVDAIKDVTVKLKFSKDTAAIPMENKGAGYRRLFMVGRFRYLASKKNKEDIIYAIEEPETFLHPSAQNDLLDSLVEISGDSQILITTHSPIFAGATKTCSVILCKKDNQSIYKQKGYSSLITDIIEELGIKPSYNLRDHFETIVFVEGKDDIDFLKIAAQKLNKIDFNSPTYKKKILFLFGGGKTLANFVDIDYFSQAKRKLFLILDGNLFDEKECDTQQKQSFDSLIKENGQLKVDFEKKDKASCFILKKKYIESYYHPRAIERKYGLSNKVIDYDIFPDNKDVVRYLKDKKSKLNINLKVKGNVSVFEEMSEDEWKFVSNKELENIVATISN